MGAAKIGVLTMVVVLLILLNLARMVAFLLNSAMNFFFEEARRLVICGWTKWTGTASISYPVKERSLLAAGLRPIKRGNSTPT